MDIFEEAFEALMNGDDIKVDEGLPSKLGIKTDIEDSILKNRLDSLLYSQSLLSCFRRDRGEFFDKYIRGIFWNDSSQTDREYEENMSYGRDFHLDCERVFREIPISDLAEPEISRIVRIKKQYEEMYSGSKIEFLPEYTVVLEDNVTASFDLLVKVYNEDGLSKIFIWDWKMEKILESKVVDRMQTRLYLYVCKESIGRGLDCEDLVMYYYMPKTNKSIKIQYSEEMHEENRRFIKNTIKSIYNACRIDSK